MQNVLSLIMKNLDSYILMFYHFKISLTPTDFTKRIKIYYLPRSNEQQLQKQNSYAMKINKRLYNIHSKRCMKITLFKNMEKCRSI